jgi:hypothetical protein
MALFSLPIVLGGFWVGSAEARALFSPPSAADLPGSYSGWMTVDGNDLQASVSVTVEGDSLTVRLSVPDLGSVTQGQGRIEAEGFSFQVPYDLGCPGQATFRGQQNAETRVLSGSLQAADCNGTMAGSFRFSPTGDEN